MKDYWFGEWVEYTCEDNKIDAERYLCLWRKFTLRKLKDLELIEEQWIDRDKSYQLPMTTLGIKLQMRGEMMDEEKFYYRLDGKYDPLPKSLS